MPYYLEDDLGESCQMSDVQDTTTRPWYSRACVTAALCVTDINAKGVILKAFEQYRLKTCIDYKPWSGEKNYISVFKGGG